MKYLILGDAVATVVASIRSMENGPYVYAELLGDQKSVRKISKALAKGTARHGEDRLIESGTLTGCIGESGEAHYEPLEKEQGFAVYASTKVVSDRFSVVFGADKEEMMGSWAKWLADVQFLPIPEDANLETELFERLLDMELIKPLPVTGDIVAYELKPGLSEGSLAMQNAVIDILVEKGMLGIDRLRNKLSSNAPRMDEVDPDAAKVYVQFKDFADTYNVVAYEKESDMVLAYVWGISGESWEEHKLSELFNTERIGIVEVDDLLIDINGKQMEVA